MIFFLLPQYCCFRNSELNNTLLYQNEETGNTVTKTSTYLSFKFVVETVRHYYCMLVKSYIWLTSVWFHLMFKFNILRLHYVTHKCARIEWQSWNNTGSASCALWENNLETSEKPFYIIQSDCSIYSHFLKPLHWNIHELWYQALIAMKIIGHSFL